MAALQLPPLANFHTVVLAFTGLVIVAQFAGFVHTVRSSRGPSPQRAQAKPRATASTAAAVAVTKGAAIAALWGGLIIGVYILGLG
jgi:hypothetical protein